MSGASRAWLEFVEQQEAKEALEQFEQNIRQNKSNSKGKPSPINDGILKDENHGLCCD